MNIEIDKPDDSLGYLLWQTTMQWQKLANRELIKIDITHTQFVILMSLAYLSRSSDSITQKEIADNSNTDRMMVSKILSKLENKNLVERRKHKTDTRAKCVFLTTNGLDILNKAIKIKKQENNLFFDKLFNKEKFSIELKQLIKFN